MIEKKLKEIIIEKYGSVKRFSEKIKLPYTTLDTILRRGIINANINNVIKICNALDITVDELIKNNLIAQSPKKDVEIISPEEFSKEVKLLLLKTGKISESEKKCIINMLDFVCKGEDENE